MKPFIAGLGIILIVLGLVALVHPNFDYHRHEEIARVGPVRTTFDRPERGTVSPAISAILLITGAVLIVLAPRVKQ
jgi:uncharacterized membrane protein